MPVVTKSMQMSFLQENQANTFTDCLLHYQNGEFVFIQGTDCEAPLELEDVGAGVTLAAVTEMISQYNHGKEEDDIICIDYGRVLFDTLLYDANGQINEVRGIRFYFGLRPDAMGRPQMNLIIVPIGSDSKENPSLKLLASADEAGNDVGHGTSRRAVTVDLISQDKFILFHLANE